MNSRVAVVRTVGEIVLETRATPEPGEGEALVRVAECGLCGSDTKLYSGRHPTLRPPLRLGHEFHGIVEANGPGGGAVEPGTRVAVFPPVGCGRCHNCRRGEPHVCVSMTFVGGELDGGLADLVAVPAANLVPMDPAVPDDRRVLVEPLAVGVHAAARASAAPDEEVVIIGAGPIGLFTALALRHAGVSTSCSRTSRTSGSSSPAASAPAPPSTRATPAGRARARRDPSRGRRRGHRLRRRPGHRRSGPRRHAQGRAGGPRRDHAAGAALRRRRPAARRARAHRRPDVHARRLPDGDGDPRRRGADRRGRARPPLPLEDVRPRSATSRPDGATCSSSSSRPEAAPQRTRLVRYSGAMPTDS